MGFERGKEGPRDSFPAVPRVDVHDVEFGGLGIAQRGQRDTPHRAAGDERDQKPPIGPVNPAGSAGLAAVNP